MALALEDVTLKAGRATLLKGVSLAVEPGRVTAVLGPNGAGKSTALSVLAGDLKPQGGRVVIEGRDMAAMSKSELARVRAVVGQHAAMSFPLTAYEVVALGAHPFAGPERDDIVEESMAAMDVLHLAGRDYPTLSGGERQRIQIARALVQLRPAARDGARRYLLMDEPTAHLDLKHKILALECARAFADAGGGVLCILHDLGLAQEFSDEIVLLKAGAVFSDGASGNRLTGETISALFEIPVWRSRSLLASL
jgi:iron complex transport system ATP-binding protein